VKESGALIVGGHSIDDREPKFGLSVTGLVHPDKVYKNVGANPGDALVLTKPIGVGIQTTAIKKDALTEKQLSKVIDTMAMLNKTAAEYLSDFHPNAVTDVTGFGLLGHAQEVAKGSDVTIEITYSSVPKLPGTVELGTQGIVPGGTKANHRWIKDVVAYSKDVTELEQYILCDAVTSGGLLVSIPAEEAERYVKLLHKHGINEAAIVGSVHEKREKLINVLK
jgi:selenide, water dikinase